MSLAPAKCEHLHVFCKLYNCDDIPKFFVNSHELTNVYKVKDLGVFMSSSLTWSSHIFHLHSVASSRVYHILHSFSSTNVWILLCAFTMYVRPMLEYNSPVWSLHLKKMSIYWNLFKRNSLVIYVFAVIFHLIRIMIAWRSLIWNLWIIDV